VKQADQVRPNIGSRGNSARMLRPNPRRPPAPRSTASSPAISRNEGPQASPQCQRPGSRRRPFPR